MNNKLKVFHPLTYENNNELNNTQDPISRRALEIQITEYGQTPRQIFFTPHPKRFSNNLTNDLTKQNSFVKGVKHIHFTEQDLELVQNIDDNLLGSTHITIKNPLKSISNYFINIFHR